MSRVPLVLRGEVYTARLDPTEGSEMRKTRPVVIVSNDIDNRHSPCVMPGSAAWRENRGRRGGSGCKEGVPRGAERSWKLREHRRGAPDDADGPGSAAECHGRWRIQVMVVPLTEHRGGKVYPTEVLVLPPVAGVSKPSRISCTQVRVLDKRRLMDANGNPLRRWGQLPPEVILQVDAGLRIALALD